MRAGLIDWLHISSSIAHERKQISAVRKKSVRLPREDKRRMKQKSYPRTSLVGGWPRNEVSNKLPSAKTNSFMSSGLWPYGRQCEPWSLTTLSTASTWIDVWSTTMNGSDRIAKSTLPRRSRLRSRNRLGMHAERSLSHQLLPVDVDASCAGPLLVYTIECSMNRFAYGHLAN